jgi:hypothetical protein
MILSVLLLLVAIVISVVAAYYSIIGLITIFSAAVIPIIIMASSLEVAKVMTAAWLSHNWKKVNFFLKYYLAFAVVVLMLITSLGIFGFLSKAHIIQTSAGIETTEQIIRIQSDIERQENIISRAEVKIDDAESSSGNNNTDIQTQIENEQKRIDSAYSRIQPAIDEQNEIIENARLDDKDRIKPYETQLNDLKEKQLRIDNQIKQYEETLLNTKIDLTILDETYIIISEIESKIAKVSGQVASNESEQIKLVQKEIGANVDGKLGKKTKAAVGAWVESQRERISTLNLQMTGLRQQAQNRLDDEKNRITNIIANLTGPQTLAIKNESTELLSRIDELRKQESPIVTTAREEIARIRKGAEDQIIASQALIQRLRDKITVGNSTESDEIIDAQNVRIITANRTIEELLDEKYTLETETRLLEAEIGPIKYVAEMFYSDEIDKGIIDDAVRFIILCIIFVFDPLAVLLVIAASSSIMQIRQKKQGTNLTYLSEKDFKKEDVGPPPEVKKKFSFNDSVENWANERIKDH